MADCGHAGGDNRPDVAAADDSDAVYPCDYHLVPPDLRFLAMSVTGSLLDGEYTAADGA
jgi:hypothetical protein